MKLTIFLLALCFGMIYGEICYRDGRSCAHLQCSAGQVPVCISYVCTCDTAPTSNNGCVTVQNCNDMNYWDRHHCGDHERHCIDQRCTCRHV